MIQKSAEPLYSEEVQDIRIFETDSPVGREIGREILIEILSQKGKVLGRIDDINGELVSKNSRLIEIVKNLFREGVYTYSISDEFIIRTPVTVEDGPIFIEAVVSQLNLLGFKIDRREQRYYERSK